MQDSLTPPGNAGASLADAVANWSDMAPREHFVQFYEADSFLLDSLRGYIGAALRQGRVGLVIATKAHRDELESRLAADGVDVETARASGLYIALDAADTLALFMVDGEPDPERFARAIGAVLGPPARDGREICAFGEMVALLWDQGLPDAAVRLEELWNDLAATYAFTLFCAYPLGSFNEHSHGGRFGQICRHHSRVIPSESFAALDLSDDRARQITLLQQKAAALEAEVEARRRAEDILRRHERELSAHLAAERAIRADLEIANRDLRAFAYVISHDLKEPLRGISNCAAFLIEESDESLGPRGKERIASIQRLARRSYDLLDSVLEFSRVSQDALDVREVEIENIFGLAVERLRTHIQDRGAIVTYEPTAQTIACDSGFTEQVLVQLILNGLRYNESPTRRIALSCSVSPSGAPVISVRDNGIGIDPRHQGSIFRLFKRLHPREQYGGGTGAGLAIVRRIVERHGGRIWLDSAPAEGSTFHFTLGPD